MPEFDIYAAEKRVRSRGRKQPLVNLKAVLLPLTAHVGSIATILALWFMRSGSFKFRADSRTDWIILAVLLFIAASGVLLAYKAAASPHRIVVKRSELIDLVAVARAGADVSVTNLGGDLTWLLEDLPGLKAVKAAKPGLRIRIYHDPAQFPQKISEAIEQLQGVGVEFVAYPRHFSMLPMPFRCMLVDPENADSRRVYVYARHGVPPVGKAREDHEFLWQTFDTESEFTVQIVTALNMALHSVRRAPIRVGISGINNVGKTQLAARVYELLQQGEGLQVKLFPDEFRITGGQTTLAANCLVLVSQLLNETDGDADVCLYDRTMVDNLCFLRVREGTTGSIYQALAPRIAERARALDLVVDVQTRSPHVNDTKLVTADQRRLVRRTLDEFFSTFGITTYPVFIDPFHFDGSLREAAEKVAQQVIASYRLRPN